MGRDIRRVPLDWEHPRDEHGNHKPLHDASYEDRAREWMDECIAWDNGTHEALIEHPDRKESCPFFWQWAGDPPDPDHYRPAWSSEPLGYQVYESVSEGTPVTGVFATADALIDHLVECGTDYDAPMSRDGARRFVECGHAPSMVMTASRGVRYGLEAMSDGTL